MKHTAFGWLFLGAAFFAVATTAAKGDDAQPDKIEAQIKALDDAVQEETPPRTNPSLYGPRLVRDSRPDNEIALIRDFVSQHNYAHAIEVAQRVAEWDDTVEVHKAAARLVDLLTARGESEKAENAATVKTALDDLTQAIRANAEATKFGPIQKELFDALALTQPSETQEKTAAYAQLQAADAYRQKWMDYLADKNAERSMAASIDLQNLSASDPLFMPISQTELLQRSREAANAVTEAILAKIDLASPDDLPTAIRGVREMPQMHEDNTDLSNLISAMENLASANRAYQNKNYVLALQQLQDGFLPMRGEAPGVAQPTEGWQKTAEQKIAETKDALRLQVIKALLALTDVPDPNRGESFSDYLLRIAAQEEKAANWTALEQVLQTLQNFPPGSSFTSSQRTQQDLASLRAYFLGQKMEAAGQYLDAMRFYRQSLATLGEFFPPEPPEERLSFLRKKYPDLYQQMEQQAVSTAGT
jgi:hypothetical protein